MRFTTRPGCTWFAMVGAVGLALSAAPASAQYYGGADRDDGDLEWDPTWGLHEEEWYDPSDWFDDDTGVDVEDVGGYGYGMYDDGSPYYGDYGSYDTPGSGTGYGYYDVGPYDPYDFGAYDTDYGYGRYDYGTVGYTDDWYDDDFMDDWYDGGSFDDYDDYGAYSAGVYEDWRDDDYGYGVGGYGVGGYGTGYYDYGAVDYGYTPAGHGGVYGNEYITDDYGYGDDWWMW